MQEQQWQQEEQQEQRQPEQRQPEQRQSAPCDDSCGEPCELPDEAAPEDEIEALRSEVSDLETRLATVRADFYNYRRRAEDERLRAARRVTLDRVSDFLPVLDNLDRALDVPDDGSAVLAGVKMVRRQFLD
ncbi:MAG: nucleotide exchange factor GrpE, partial [Synergistaceae bacterium]|nr:nucleotide exchange factor GrpE [Synergistaceae bacterium]